MRFLLPLAMGIAFATAAQSAPITIGSLSSNDDGSTEVVTDSLNNREWLRWDILDDLTYAETVAATGAGGAYDGWTIGDINDAQLFVDALLGTPNSCTTAQSVSTSCGTFTGSMVQLVGDNHGLGDGDAFAWFLSNNGTGAEAGFLFSVDQSGEIFKRNEYNAIATTDQFAANGTASSDPVSWLLYRDVPAVPVPAGLPLLLTGLAAFGMARSRRQAK